MQSIGGTPERPVFNVVGLAPFTTLDLNLRDTDTDDVTPGAAIEMISGTAPSGSPSFYLYDFTINETVGRLGAGSPGVDGSGTITADAAGAKTFTVGVTITTSDGTETVDYENLDYTATFDVTVNY